MSGRVLTGSSRERLLLRISRRLSRGGYPRLGLLAVMMLAGASGFLLSVAMLDVGLHAPSVRYPLAVAGGYAAFLLLLRLWLAWRRGEGGFDIDFSGFDAGGVGEPSAVSFSGDVPSIPEFGGGQFSGGGSSGSFDSALDVVTAAPVPVPSVDGPVDSVLGAAADADEGVVLVAALLVAVAVVVGIGATVTVVYNAPTLMAELLLDGAIATVVYRRVRTRSSQHWAVGVLRRTWKPLLAIASALFVLGALIPVLVPGADSIGDLFR